MFGACSVTCGIGIRKRSRKCNNPTLLANGKSCDYIGTNVQIKVCTAFECPGNIIVSGILIIII